MRSMLTSLLAIGLFSSSALGQDKKLSGPQPGEKVTSFKVLQIVNAEKVKELEIVKPTDKGSTLVCFLHKITEPSIGFMMHVDFYASKQKGLNNHYVVLTEDRAKTKTQLQRWARRPFLSKSPMSISLDGPEGPGEYGLNRNVAATVLVVKNGKVVNSFAFEDPNSNDSQTIVTAIAKVLGKKAPSFDEVRKGLRAERQKRREKALAQNPIVKLAPKTELGLIMLRMIRTEGNRAENAKRRSKELLEWAGENKERKAQLKKYCKAMLKGEFEINEYSRKAIQKLAGD